MTTENTPSPGDSVAFEDGVMAACFSCNKGVEFPACERPGDVWVYDAGFGWRCPSCAEQLIEGLRAEVAELERVRRRAEIYAAALTAIATWNEMERHTLGYEGPQRVARQALDRVSDIGRSPDNG